MECKEQSPSKPRDLFRGRRLESCEYPFWCLCDGAVTAVSSFSTFARALGDSGAEVVPTQGWSQKSCFRDMVKGVLNLSLPDQGGPQQDGKRSDGQMALRHLQRGHSPSTHLSQICSYTRFRDESILKLLALLACPLPSTPPLPHHAVCGILVSQPHVASAGASSLKRPPEVAEEPVPELLTWCLGCAHARRHFGASFPTWALELKSNTKLTLGRRLTVLSLPGRSFTAESQAAAPRAPACGRIRPGFQTFPPSFQTRLYQGRGE